MARVVKPSLPARVDSESKQGKTPASLGLSSIEAQAYEPALPVTLVAMRLTDRHALTGYTLLAARVVYNDEKTDNKPTSAEMKGAPARPESSTPSSLTGVVEFVMARVLDTATNATLTLVFRASYDVQADLDRSKNTAWLDWLPSLGVSGGAGEFGAASDIRTALRVVMTVLAFHPTSAMSLCGSCVASLGPGRTARTIEWPVPAPAVAAPDAARAGEAKERKTKEAVAGIEGATADTREATAGIGEATADTGGATAGIEEAKSVGRLESAGVAGSGAAPATEEAKSAPAQVGFTWRPRMALRPAVHSFGARRVITGYCLLGGLTRPPRARALDDTFRGAVEFAICRVRNVETDADETMVAGIVYHDGRERNAFSVYFVPNPGMVRPGDETSTRATVDIIKEVLLADPASLIGFRYNQKPLPPQYESEF
jgi:hypothetical protein